MIQTKKWIILIRTSPDDDRGRKQDKKQIESLRKVPYFVKPKDIMNEKFWTYFWEY